MKKINENQKVTLTLGQLKRLVNESASFDDFENDIRKIIRREMSHYDDEFPAGSDVRLAQMIANELWSNWYIQSPTNFNH